MSMLKDEIYAIFSIAFAQTGRRYSTEAAGTSQLDLCSRSDRDGF